MGQFHLAAGASSGGDALSYCASTLEAAVTHIRCQMTTNNLTNYILSTNSIKSIAENGNDPQVCTFYLFRHNHFRTYE
jgi:hypothetical protein